MESEGDKLYHICQIDVDTQRQIFLKGKGVNIVTEFIVSNRVHSFKHPIKKKLLLTCWCKKRKDRDRENSVITYSLERYLGKAGINTN